MHYMLTGNASMQLMTSLMPDAQLDLTSGSDRSVYLTHTHTLSSNPWSVCGSSPTACESFHWAMPFNALHRCLQDSQCDTMPVQCCAPRFHGTIYCLCMPAGMQGVHHAHERAQPPCQCLMAPHGRSHALCSLSPLKLHRTALTSIYPAMQCNPLTLQCNAMHSTCTAMQFTLCKASSACPGWQCHSSIRTRCTSSQQRCVHTSVHHISCDKPVCVSECARLNVSWGRASCVSTCAHGHMLVSVYMCVVSIRVGCVSQG